MPEEPIDIPDPVVPASVLQGIPQQDTPPVDLTKPSDVCAVLVHEELQTLRAELHALKQSAITEEARITAQSPAGYQVMLITRKSTPGELITSINAMQDWLKSAGYTANEIPF